MIQRLLSRLIEHQDRPAVQDALHWLYGFIRPQRLAIAGLLGLSMCATALVLVQP